MLRTFVNKAKDRLKFHPGPSYEGPEGGFRYRYTLPVTSELDLDGRLTPHPGRLHSEKRPGIHLTRGSVGTQHRSGRLRKISTSPGLDLQIAQPVASRYTDYVIEVHVYIKVNQSRYRPGVAQRVPGS